MNEVSKVRRFNRLVTQRVGALDSDYLARGRPLGEARIIHEIGSAGAGDLQALRVRLGLDSGYMSRLLRSLEKQGLVRLTPKPEDSRARVVSLTDAGREEFAAYDAMSDDLAERLLGSLDTSLRTRLVSAMDEVVHLLRAARIEVAPETAAGEDAQFCLQQYYAELQSRFDAGFDPQAGKPVDVADMSPPEGRFVIARIEGELAGCGALVRLGDDVGEIKRVWTAPCARGQGVAGAILENLEASARQMGFAVLRLDTNRSLKEATALYRQAGYREIGRYNDNPYAHHWFEKRL